MEYCSHVWAGALSYYLTLLGKLQKRICSALGLSVAASLEPLAYLGNVASLGIIYRYYFGRCSSELAQMVPLPCSRGRSHYSNRLHDFLSPFLYVTRMSMSTVSFLAQLDYLPRTYLPTECFPLTYDLNGFKSRYNRHLLTASSF